MIGPQAVDQRLVPAEGPAARAAAEAVARRSYGKLVAFLAARTRDVPMLERCTANLYAAAPRDGKTIELEWLKAGGDFNDEAVEALSAPVS